MCLVCLQSPRCRQNAVIMNDIEIHPFEPFLPKEARLLMLGTFPPAPKRWCMPWYYPNFTNDMWRIIGLIFFNDREHFVDREHKTYRQEALQKFLGEKGIALYDTCTRIRRTKGTASDKDLEVVEPTDLDRLLSALPICALSSVPVSWPPRSLQDITASMPEA